MRAKTSIPVVTILALFLVAPQWAAAFASKSPPPSEPAVEAGSGEPTVWITKPDGAQQCAPESGQSLEFSASELKKAHVHILNSRKGSDKKFHSQMCGIPSGRTNTFEISKDDLPKAIALGYHEVKSAGY